ncbi:MAG: HNH endonuclease [Chloroflexi bacterium]|nr:HNH endonuclease [Chloroflexota bacterium]
MTSITNELRRQVIERAGNCCEYCLLSQDDNFFSFHIDHIISEKHGGVTESHNLSLSCPNCNTFKGSDIGSIDSQTGLLTPLFNPRLQQWVKHFHLGNGMIEPLTPEGRVTVFLLRLNQADRVFERQELMSLGRYPCPTKGYFEA